MEKIGFGGGCHWCTEAVFQSLKGVSKVEQGFIAPLTNESSFSEAVIVHYQSEIIGLKELIEIHLLTHKSTSQHSMRKKYRSAIYTFDEDSKVLSIGVLEALQSSFEQKIVTEVLSFGLFKPSDSRFHNYYYSNPEKPFCEVHIAPKLIQLKNKFVTKLNTKDLIRKVD